MGPGTSLVLALGVILAAQVEGLPPPMYSAKPVRGVVVDAGAGAPLEGVIVVAQWILDEPGKGSWRRLHVFETTTDAAGNYLIPGWGPKPNAWYPWTRLRDKDPEVSFFRRGYGPLTIQNRWDRNEALRFSEWDGKTINLQKFTGNDDQRVRELRLLQGALAWGWGVVDWRLMPRMTLALEEERLLLEQKRLKVSNLSALSVLGTTIEEIRRFLEGPK